MADAFDISALSEPEFRRLPRNDPEFQQMILTLFLKLQSALTTATLATVSGIPNIVAVSATDAGSDATIDIAAFTLQIPDRDPIAYSAGQITGLAYDTVYYVYTDDPDLQGVSVYKATTNPQELGMITGRVRVGQVMTPSSGGGAVTGGGGGNTGFGTGAPGDDGGILP